MARKRYLIIGDGAAGVMAAQTLRTLDSNARIAILSDDPHPGYFRAALTNYLLGELREDQLWAVPPDFYTTARVSRVFCRVVALDTARSQVWEASGAEPIPYDALLVASGARPRAADFPGAHLRGNRALGLAECEIGGGARRRPARPRMGARAPRARRESPPAGTFAAADGQRSG